MQRTEAEGVIVSCDFCKRDWDGQEPMIEGHHGSVICLPCLERALAERGVQAGAVGEGIEGEFECTLCLRPHKRATVAHWPVEAKAGEAVVCQGCVELSAKTFSKSPLTDWKYTPEARG